MKNSILTFCFLLFCAISFAQNINYRIMGSYKKAILKEQLNAAKTLKDINSGYPSSWISNYISVEVSTTSNGIAQKATNKNDQLNSQQIGILKTADIGTEVVVDVKYRPKNAAQKEEIRHMNFTYTIIPEVEAHYPYGERALDDYVRLNALNKIPLSFNSSLKQVNVNFLVTAKGEITNAQVTLSSGDDAIDKLLLEAIQKMPNWTPAEDKFGKKLEQELEFSIGYMVGC